MKIIIRSPIEIEITEGRRDTLRDLLPLAMPFLASLMRVDRCDECDDEPKTDAPAAPEPGTYAPPAVTPPA